jgi:putative amidase-like protein
MASRLLVIQGMAPVDRGSGQHPSWGFAIPDEWPVPSAIPDNMVWGDPVKGANVFRSADRDRYTRSPRRTLGLGVLVALVVAATIATIGSVQPRAHKTQQLVPQANTTSIFYGTVTGTGGIGLNVRSSPSTSGARVAGLPEGTRVAFDCYVYGQTIAGYYYTGALWQHTVAPYTGFVTDTYLNTGVNGPVPGEPQCGSAPAPAPPPPAPTQKYNRNAAIGWAKSHYGDSYYFPDDCTFFVSRALWAGGLPRSAMWTDSTTDQRYVSKHRQNGPVPSRDASLANALKDYLVSQAGLATIHQLDFNQPMIQGAQLGDVIGYDWDPPRPDGFLDHLAIITAFSPTGYPLVSAHSDSLLNGGWRWSYHFSAPIVDVYTHNGNRPRAYLIHIAY